MTTRAGPAGPQAPAGAGAASGAIRSSVVGADPDVSPALTLAAGTDGPLIDGLPGRATLESLEPPGPGIRRARLRGAPDGDVHACLIVDRGDMASHARAGITRREVVVDGWRFEIELESAARAELRERAGRGREEASSSGPASVRAIIPGVVVAVSVTPGDVVTAGQQLLVVEAMKMQNELRAPRSGTIGQVAVGQGTTIDVGDLLVVIE